ncbi:MAG: hypothetical protein JSV37_08840 [Anaerolineaceae bacterium]|nr:MAG: hypothetical protein JSV37_08840 [Anaerolineaceae bacterium]
MDLDTTLIMLTPKRRVALAEWLGVHIPERPDQIEPGRWFSLRNGITGHLTLREYGAMFLVSGDGISDVLNHPTASEESLLRNALILMTDNLV